MALLNQTQRKSSDELMKELLGTDKPDSLDYLVLSNDETTVPKFEYVDGQRTEKVVGMGVTLHIFGLGVEIDVKVEQPNFTLANAGLGECKRAKPINLQVSNVNNNYYWRADNLVPSDKKAE